jgi:hypothetical protein
MRPVDIDRYGYSINRRKRWDRSKRTFLLTSSLSGVNMFDSPFHFQHVTMVGFRCKEYNNERKKNSDTTTHCILWQAFIQ